MSQVLRTQFASPKTRQRAWAWLQDNFDARVARAGQALAGSAPWYASSLCTEQAAQEVQRFFERRVSELAGGPRNLASAVETITLCAAKADAHRTGIDRAF